MALLLWYIAEKVLPTVNIYGYILKSHAQNLDHNQNARTIRGEKQI
jgi:hypothetical protein